jgi:hypothetical protein
MSDEGLGKGRMEAISDGVFAVAMTLMLADVVTAEGAEDWRKNWADKTALFLVTFGISSTYWIAHNNECRYVRKTDRLVQPPVRRGRRVCPSVGEHDRPFRLLESQNPHRDLPFELDTHGGVSRAMVRKPLAEGISDTRGI